MSVQSYSLFSALESSKVHDIDSPPEPAVVGVIVLGLALILSLERVDDDGLLAFLF